MSEFAPHSSRAAAGDTQATPDASTWGLAAGSGAAPAAPAPVPPSVILGAVAARAGVSPIVARAAEAWLDNEEVYELLHNFAAHGLAVSSKPAQNPPSGTLFIYDRSTTRNFRQDGVRYIMRTDRPQSAKESNMKLKVNDVKVMNVSYASCPPQGSNGSQDGDEDVVFRRRVYSLWPKRAGGGPDFVLVHYLREKAGSKARRSSLTRSHQPPLQFAGAVRTTPKLEPSAAPVQPDAPLSIVEFSPNWDTSRGGAKILVCLSGDHATLQRLHSKELPAQCQFGALTVPAECVAPGVLRCIAPMHTAGTVPFSVALDGNPVSEYKRFEYRPPAVAHMPKPSAFGRYGPHDTNPGAAGAAGAGSQGQSLSGTNGFHTQSFGSLPGFGGQSDLLELLSGSGPRDSMTDLMLDDGALSVSPSGLSIDADLAADIDMNVNGSPGAFLSPFAADTPTDAAEQPGFPPSASAALVQAVAGTAAGVVAHASAAGVAASQGLTTFAAQPGMSIPSPTTWGTDTTFAGAGAGAGAGGGGQAQASSGARPQFAAPFVGSGGAGVPPPEQHADRDSVMRRPKIRRRDAAAVRAARVRAREEPHRDRETKIRIVERLGRVENSLSNHQRQGGAHDGAAGAGVAADGFLDDAALEGMSDEKLQALTEQLLEHVINELTKHASEEEALMQELITSDVNGMTMLHYTCMYNYPRLVPVLLANGADPNKPTAAGQSPLHLAASHGQWDIVAQLIHAGASALSRDKSGLTPHMRAYRNGHKALGAKLQSIAIRQAHLAGLTVESAAGTTAGFGTPARTPHISPTNAADGAMPPVPPSSVTSSGSTPPAPPSSSHNAPRTGLTLLGEAIGGPASNPRTLSRSSSAGDGGKSEEEEEEEEETRKLLLNAFSNMTLHDKCAISLVMGRDKDGAGGLEAGLGLPDGLFGGVGGLRDTDVASVLSDNDASLVQAMSLMSDEEQLSLEADARRIQTNVRSWLLRRNYRSMRDAARKLQAATRGMLARKNFEVHKHKAFAALVIQRATRTWLKSFGDVTATRSARKTSSHGSLHPVPEE